MATFSVNDQARRAQSTGNGSATDFSFSFQVNSTSDVKVYVGDTLKTLSTHYTIVDSSAAAGLNTDGTGVVKFITSPTDYTPADGDVVTILSDVPVARTSVYTSGGNITAASLESDFDTITMQVADREERDARQLTAPVSDPTSIDMTLPAKASRLGKVLGFNSSTGNPEAVDNAALTNAEVRAAVEAASDSNVFTDADHSKLDGIEASATADQTDAEIRAAVEAATDSNVFTDADHSKLDGIEASADVTDTANVVAALTAGTNVSIANDGTISATDTNTTYTSSDFNHDDLTGFVANEHIDWTADQGATNIHSGNYTNTTYSVGDGGLTQNNFTDALKSKLDAIEANATADQTASEIEAIVNHDNLQGFVAAEHIDWTSDQGSTNIHAGNYTNTTYSVGDGGLTQNNFTNTLKSKLDGIEASATADQTASEIKTAYESNSDTNAFTDAEKTKLSGVAASANNYVHPNHSGEVTSTADGATVIADNVVDEANLKVSNSPTDGYVLTARSGNTGGLTWEAASGGGGGSALTIKEEGTALSTAATSLDFVGAAVTASGTGADKTITIDSLPSSGGTFTGDVTFEGAQYTNRNVVWDKSDSALEFADNAKIVLGQQSDLQIYHNAQDSYIQANISGHLYLRNATDDYDVVIQSDSGAGGIADYFRADGSTGEAKLFHYGSEKLKTQSGGVDITGDITVSGTVDGRDIAVNIPSSLGTAGQVLTVNSGASAAEWADASGGGGDPDLYSDSANGSAVTPTSNAGGSFNSVAIGNGADIGSGRGDSIAIGTDALANQSQALAIGRSATVNPSGTWGTAVGRNSVVNGQSAVALGNSYSGGTDSFAVGIDTNSSSYGATGANSIAMGYQAKATNSYATVSGGASNVASGYHSTVIGGSSNLADNIGSTVLGGRYGTTRGIRGAAVFGGYGNQITATQGTSQSGLYILAEQTTDATATALKTDNQSSSSTANQIVLPNGGAYAFTGTIVGREAASSGTECAAWRVEGLIRREANAGSTVLVNSSTTVLNNAPSWGMALSADTTNGALAITVTGAAKTIRWVATIQTTELTFA